MLEGTRDREMIRGESALTYVDYFSPELLCRFVLSKRLTDDCEAREHRRNFGPVLSLAPLDVQQTQQKWFGNAISRMTQGQAHKIVESEHNLGIIADVLSDSRESPNERLRSIGGAAQDMVRDQTLQRRNARCAVA
jgi:hypothetical protein